MIVRLPISKTGYHKLREELMRLESKERIDVIHAITEARAHGDIKENAEFHAAKERQSHIEGRIMELKDKLGRAEIFDCTTVDCDRAMFGTVVKLFDLDTEEEITYQLLGPDDSDVRNGSISVLSPVGKAVVGHLIGDEVMVTTPRGVRHLEIVDITRAAVE